MIFTRKPEQELQDFIEKPSQECKEEELQRGVNSIINILTIKSSNIIDLISSHEYITPVVLLDDLAEKMKKLNCLEKLGKLFDECLYELVGLCIYNIHDMLRFINIMPFYSNTILETILSNQDCIVKLFGSDKPETLEDKLKNYPRQVTTLVVMPHIKLQDGQMYIKSGEKETLLFSIITEAGKIENDKLITKLELKGELQGNYNKFSEALKTKDVDVLTTFLPDILTITSKQGYTLSNYFEEFFKKNDEIRVLLDTLLSVSITNTIMEYRGYSRRRSI